MPDPATLATQFRESLYDLDTDAARQMAAAYQDAYRAMSDRLTSWTRLRAELIDKVAANETVLKGIVDAAGQGSAWYGKSTTEIAHELAKMGNPVFEKTINDLAAVEFQTKRWAQDSLAMQAALERYTKVAEGITTDSQGEAIGLGTNDMGALINAEMPESLGYSYAHPDDRALRAMVGFTQNGAPLSSLFERLAPDMMASVRQTLLTGIALGTNPSTLAYQLRGPLGIPLWRSLTIARTETLRAYREGQRATIAANADVLEGWVWRCARDRRSCEVCWANDGQVFPLDLPDGTMVVAISDVPGMEEHVNGRCTLVPRAKSYAEILGDPSLPDNRPKWATGPEAFAGLDPAIQAEILGPGKFDLYQRGYPITDMWQRSGSAEWGTSRVSRPLRDMLEDVRLGYVALRPLPKAPEPTPEPVAPPLLGSDTWKKYEKIGQSQPSGDYAKMLWAELPGYNGLPEVVSPAELDAHIAAGEVEMYRGMRTGGSRGTWVGAGGPVSYADALREGDSMYIGNGIYGNGSYWASGPEGPETYPAQKIAARFAGLAGGFGSSGQIVRGTVKAGARVISYADLEVEWYKAINDYSAERHAAGQDVDITFGTEGGVDPRGVQKETPSVYGDLPRVLRQPTYYAAAQGYDAVFIPKSDRIGWDEFGDQWVVLNRSALRVSTETWTEYNDATDMLIDPGGTP